MLQWRSLGVVLDELEGVLLTNMLSLKQAIVAVHRSIALCMRVCSSSAGVLSRDGLEQLGNERCRGQTACILQLNRVAEGD